MTKKEKTEAVLAAAGVFARAFRDPKTSDEAFEKAGEALTSAVEALTSHTAEIKEHPGASYEEVEIRPGKKVKRARCKFCGKELNPRGVKRHVLSDGCKAAFAELEGMDTVEDAEELEQAITALAEEFGVQYPPEEAGSDDSGDDDGDDD